MPLFTKYRRWGYKNQRLGVLLGLLFLVLGLVWGFSGVIMANKIPIIDIENIDGLIAEAIKNDGVLTAPKEISQMLVQIQGVSISSKPRKDGRFQGYILDNGDKKYVYGKTREEVAITIKHFLKNGVPKKKKSTKKMVNGVPQTFNSFARYYFENFRKKKVAVQTFRCDLNRYNRYIEPHFGETFIKKITPENCQNLLDEIKSKGYGKTADEIYSLLSVIFKMAISHGIITRSPLGIVYHEKHEREHGSALTKQEENTLLTALKGSPYLSTVAVMLYTGLRPNELKTAIIDGKFIKAVNSKRKTKKVQYKRIPISVMLRPYLINGIKSASLNFLRELVRNILPNHKLYDLRTTFNTRLEECGVSQTAIKYFMGHSLGVLQDTYTDLSDEYLLKEGEKYNY